jgi:hypothetical protein
VALASRFRICLPTAFVRLLSRWTALHAHEPCASTTSPFSERSRPTESGRGSTASALIAFTSGPLIESQEEKSIQIITSTTTAADQLVVFAPICHEPQIVH